ncbi:MAG: hypothetical protein SCABRO_00347 [Candidatus Scalindua brodae]|uniref:Uncharacterized protein n=1 Tax=Candidatus Scalindua brodae TaxID=237368 RepID=A0A0B0ETA7_9BACT|nr:MAG: hypothetical protein SCABRO_00347 [Candidatus Scalindua brodae]
MEKYIYCILLGIEMIKIFKSKESCPLSCNIQVVKMKTCYYNFPLSEVGITL